MSRRHRSQRDAATPAIGKGEFYTRVEFSVYGRIWGQEGQNDAMEDNKRLVGSFVVNSVRDWLLLPKEEEGGGGGEIHLMHKTKPPYHQCNLPRATPAGFRITMDDDENRNRTKATAGIRGTGGAAQVSPASLDSTKGARSKILFVSCRLRLRVRIRPCIHERDEEKQ